MAYKSKTGDGVQPKTIEINDAKDNVSDLVQLVDVNIIEDEGKFYAQKGMFNIQLFDGFHQGYKFYCQAACCCEGYLANYNGTYEIYPLQSLSLPLSTK